MIRILSEWTSDMALRSTTLSASQLRSATTKAGATDPVLVEVELNGDRRPIVGWRLEGNPTPTEPTPQVLVLELGDYKETNSAS